MCAGRSNEKKKQKLSARLKVIRISPSLSRGTHFLIILCLQYGQQLFFSNNTTENSIVIYRRDILFYSIYQHVGRTVCLRFSFREGEREEGRQPITDLMAHKITSRRHSPAISFRSFASQLQRSAQSHIANEIYIFFVAAAVAAAAAVTVVIFCIGFSFYR